MFFNDLIICNSIEFHVIIELCDLCHFFLHELNFIYGLTCDLFLHETNSKGVTTRPIWTLMNKLPMFKDAQCGNLTNSEWLEERVVNLPSSVIL